MNFSTLSPADLNFRNGLGFDEAHRLERIRHQTISLSPQTMRSHDYPHSNVESPMP